MIKELIIIAILTFLPFLELRASIPYGILKTDIHWSLVFLICVLINIILAPIVYYFLNKILHIFLRIRWIKRLWDYYIAKTQKKIHHYVERYGWLGVAVFIGIPLPGSGVYSGALASYILGLSFKRFMIAAVLGVLIAGTIVTIVVLSGTSIFSVFVKII